MNIVCVALLCVFFFCSPSRAAEPLEPWASFELEYSRIQKSLSAELADVGAGVAELDEPTALLVFSCASLRSPSNGEVLVRLLPGVYINRPSSVGSFQIPVSVMPGELDRHPAAASLRAIGVPAVQDLCREAERLEAAATNEQVSLVGGSLRVILNWHTRHYLEWRRRTAGPRAQGVYQRLISLDVVSGSAPRAAAGSGSGGAISPRTFPKFEPREPHGAMLVSSALFSTERQDHENRAALEIAARDWRRRVDSRVLEVIDAIPKNSLTLTTEQIGAIDAAGRYQVRDAVPKLMSLCTIRVADRLEGRERGTLSSFPAARTLGRLGWNASFAIREELQSRDAIIPPDRLIVFAMILREIWAGYAEEFVKVERLEAPRYVDGSVHDKLLVAIRNLE